MLTDVAKSFVLSSILLLSAGSAWAQDDARVTRAIEQLGNESPAVRARARTTILRMGKPGLSALRRAISAPDEVLPEHLFMIAEELGRERRRVRFELHKDLPQRSYHVAWRPGGKELGILQFGSTVGILDSELEPTGDRFGEKAMHFAFGPLDRSFAYNGDREVVIVERETGRRMRLPAESNQPKVVYSPDGRHVVTAEYGYVAEMWSVADGTNVHRFQVDREGGLTPVFSPDGKLLAIGNRNGKTHIFDVTSGEELHVLDRKMTHQPAFSPDGTLLAICYVDGKIGIWSVADGKQGKLLDSGAEEVFTVAWSPDGSFLASAGLSAPIVIWSGEHLAKLHTLDPGSERTFRLAFRPDGKMLAAAGNQTTRTWTVESKQ